MPARGGWPVRVGGYEFTQWSDGTIDFGSKRVGKIGRKNAINWDVIIKRVEKELRKQRKAQQGALVHVVASQNLPPRLGERILLLILRTKEERVNIPGDLEEEFAQIAAKHGPRYAKVWYYKQVTASMWPMIWKTFRWGLLASVGEWIRRVI